MTHLLNSNLNSLVNWMPLRSLAFIATCCFISGCNNQTVVVKPEAGGLVPPDNPPELIEELKQPEVIASGAKPWLDTKSLPIESWYSLYMNGRCIGYSQVSIAPSETQATSLLRLTKRDVLEVPATTSTPLQRREITQVSLERPNGEFLSYTETTDNGETTTEASAQLLRETLTTTRIVDGQPKTASLAWPTGAWGPLGIIAMLRQYSTAPSQSRSGQIFMPQLSKFATVEMKSGTKVWTTLPGSEAVELLLVETNIQSDSGTSTAKNWLNAQGEIVKSVSRDGLSMFRSTKAEAERIDSEIQAAQLVAMKIPIAATAEQLQVAEATFTIDSARIDPFGVLSSNVNQQTKSLSALGAELTVHRATPSDPAIDGIPQDLPTPAHSQLIDADTLQLKKFLAELPTTESTQLTSATQLTEAVFRTLKKEGNSRQFLTPAETLNSRSGDCKAHTALLIAALRQRNIPARAASGLRIVKADNEIVAIYHMWCEAWVNDRWLPLDPFAGSIGIGVDHIKFLEASLNTADRNSAMLPVLQTMKQLTISLKQ